MFGTWKYCLAIVFLVSALNLHAQAAGSSEAQARNNCAKAFGSSLPEERRASLAGLNGAKERASWQLLYQIVTTDKDDLVRKTAFQILCGCKDDDGTLAHLIALGFKAEKDRDIKVELATMMKGQDFKYDIVEALATYLASQRYPDLPTNTGQNNNNNNGGNNPPPGGGGSIGSTQNNGQSRALAQKSRDNYDKVLQILNAIAGTTFSAKRESPDEVKKWWAQKGIEFRKVDGELLAKRKAEADALAAQHKKEKKDNKD